LWFVVGGAWLVVGRCELGVSAGKKRRLGPPHSKGVVVAGRLGWDLWKASPLKG